MDGQGFVKLLQECLTSPLFPSSSSPSSSSSSSSTISINTCLLTLLELIIKKEIRDFDFTTLTTQLYTKLMKAHFNTDLSEAKEDLPTLYPFMYWALLIDLPEVNRIELAALVDADAITIAFQALVGYQSCCKPLQRFYLKWIEWIYAYNTSHRSKLRGHVGKALNAIAHNYNPRADTTGLLNLLTKIIQGMQTPIQEGVCEHICHGILVPLHTQNGMTAWRDQEPILKTYHNALVCCQIVLIEKSRTSSSSPRIPVVCTLILEILKIWPEKFNTNTPKEILLLVGVSSYMLSFTYI